MTCEVIDACRPSRQIGGMPSAVNRTAPAAPAGASHAHRLPLAWLLAGVVVSTYDFFSVNLLLPALARQWAATPAQLQWVVAAYGLSFGVALLAGSRLAELWGAEQAFGRGLLGFAAATLGAALAPRVEWLLACRLAQGLAAALFTPQVLTLLARQPEAMRQRGLAGYGVALGVGPALGQLVAGLALAWGPAGSGWRTVFALNALLAGAAALAFRAQAGGAGRVAGGPPAPAGAAGRPGAAPPPRMDWAGVLLLCAAMAALVLPLIEGRRLHWPAWLLLPALGGALGLALAWRRSRDAARAQPPRLALIDPAALARPPFRWALATLGAFYAINASFYLVLSMTLQAHYRLPPLAAAAVFTLMVASFLLPTLLARPLQARLGARGLRGGAWALAAGHALMGGLLWQAAPLAWLLPALLLTGLAIGLVMAPLVGAAAAAGGGGSGVSGLAGSAQWLGNALGAAALGTLYFGVAGADAAGGLPQAALGEAAVHAVCVGVALVVALLLRRWA